VVVIVVVVLQTNHSRGHQECFWVGWASQSESK
jgi:hypothetical protein